MAALIRILFTGLLVLSCSKNQPDYDGGSGGSAAASGGTHATNSGGTSSSGGADGGANAGGEGGALDCWYMYGQYRDCTETPLVIYIERFGSFPEGGYELELNIEGTESSCAVSLTDPGQPPVPCGVTGELTYTAQDENILDVGPAHVIQLFSQVAGSPVDVEMTSDHLPPVSLSDEPYYQQICVVSDDDQVGASTTCGGVSFVIPD